MTKAQDAFSVLLEAIIEREPDEDYIPIFCDVPNILLNISDEEFDRLLIKHRNL